jgi:hypothetical protein
MALFCNAIHNTDRIDMKPLAGFVSSLESSRTLSEGAENLYRMFLLFLKIAEFYIQAKEQEINEDRTQSFTYQKQHRANEPVANYHYRSTTAQFDPHLSALGLVSDPATSMVEHSDSLMSQEQVHYLPDHNSENFTSSHGADSSYRTMFEHQGSVQDWFLGSRFLIDFMDLDSNLQMPDISNAYLQ